MTTKLARSSRLVCLLAVWISLAPAAIGAEEKGGEELSFSKASIFFELNDSDGDLGIHALIDGDAWKSLSIETPDERENLRISVKGRLRQQGLTEIFFESAEPTFDELPPERFFKRFSEGIYEIEGLTLDGQELEGEAVVTHLIPAPVDDLMLNGEELPHCDDELPVIDADEDGDYEVSWDHSELSHPELGRTGEPIKIARYEVIVEGEGVLNVSAVLPPDVTSYEFPAELFETGDEAKVEVLVREEGGNQTARETCFVVGEVGD